MNVDTNANAHTRAHPLINDNVRCLLIAALEIAGGVYIIGVFLYNYGFAIPNYWLALILSPGIWGIYGGVLLWMGRPKGLTHSILIQAIQIVAIEGPFIAWRLFLGLEVSIGWMNPGTVIRLGYGGSSYVTYSNPALSFGVAVNILALASLIYLIKLKRRIHEQPLRAADIEPPASDSGQ